MGKWESNISIRTLDTTINRLDYWQRKDIWTLAKKGFHLATNHREIFLILKSSVLFSWLSQVDILVFIPIFLREWGHCPPITKASNLLVTTAPLRWLLSSLWPSEAAAVPWFTSDDTFRFPVKEPRELHEWTQYSVDVWNIRHTRSCLPGTAGLVAIWWSSSTSCTPPLESPSFSVPLKHVSCAHREG